jgi:hypothetical protein
MERINIDALIAEIKACVDRHRIGEFGEYARRLWGENCDLGINEYGCADAANILYSISSFPRDEKERNGFVKTLRGMQDPKTGLYNEPTHHPIHTTAHCFAALELFDASPLYPCYALAEFATDAGIHKILEEEVDWTNPWRGSHKGAGIFVCLTMTGAVGLEWKDSYFKWLWDHSDEETGFFHYGDKRTDMLHHMMAGGFHYFFNHEAERRPYRYPERVIDSCLVFMNDPEPYGMIEHCRFIDVDVVFCLNRAMRQTPHRFHEAKDALEKYAEAYIDMMMNIDYANNKSFNDLHCLFGAVCCLCELQIALPGKIATSKPLRSVLDRRPFI